MERAGAALAEAAYRFAGPRPTLILCGPGTTAETVMLRPGISPNVAWMCASQCWPSRPANRRNGQDRNGLGRLNIWPLTRSLPRF
jgi:hypothetical protein